MNSKNSILSTGRLRLNTFLEALRHLSFSALFFAGAVPLWFILWFSIYVLISDRRALRVGTPEHWWIAIAITSGIFLFGFIGLLFNSFKMESQQASLGEGGSNPLWQICLLPSFLAASGVRNLLQCLLLLAVNHRALRDILVKIHFSRLYLSDLQRLYPWSWWFYQKTLLAFPNVQLLNSQDPYFLLPQRVRKKFFGEKTHNLSQSQYSKVPDDGPEIPDA